MATESAAAAAEKSGGMPQLDFATFPNQIFWLLVALVVIYMVLSRVALPRIGGAMADRTNTITGDLAAAEELKQKAENAEAAYEKALADARAEAQVISAKMKADVQSQLDVEMAKADAEISARSAEAQGKLAEIRDNAVASVNDVAKDVAAEIVAAMGGKADAKTVNAAVAARMKG